MLKVAVVQMDIRKGEPEANRAKVREMVERAVHQDQGTQVILLPELWHCGYVLDRAGDFSSPGGEEEALFLGGLAREFGVWFAGGSVLAEVEGGFVNRAQIINPQGDLVAHYDKVHLVPMLDEHLYLKGGRAYCQFDLEGVKCGFVICYDIRFCEFLRKHALMGAQAVFVAAEWPSARLEHWKTLLRARAIENQMYVIASNHCGINDQIAFGGSSTAIAPDGTVLFDMGFEEGVRHVVLDVEKVEEVRRRVPVFRDRVPEIY